VTKIPWQPLIKPAILLDIYKLPEKEVQQVFSKIGLLVQDPIPDGKTKKLVRYINRHGRQVYRLRCGRYRIFYTLEKQHINILTIRPRDDDTYKDDVEIDDNEDDLLADDFDIDELVDADIALHADTTLLYQTSILNTPVSQSRLFPEPITVELLNKLQVPLAYHVRLLRVQDEDALLECYGIDEDTLLRIDEYMFDRPLIQIMEQPDLVLREVDDLLRYKEGELLAFLLKLSPEQEKYARWSPQVTGPTLVKGSPGTGKSTVALHRIRSLLEQLLEKSNGRGTGEPPRLLFTTYTNALVEASKQLLLQLLGPNAQYVRVDTADRLAFAVLRSCGVDKEIIDEKELRQLTRQAVAEAKYDGRSPRQFALRQAIERMGYDYLLQELNSIIVARQLTTLDAYLKTPRNGRRLRLGATERTALWRVYERWCQLLAASGKETWQQRRARAASLVEQTELYHAFDTVVIDEAQDLDPSVLRMLIQLCKASNRLFITADANQSIYGSGFNWSDVHEDLKFQGRTSILRANYRSTAEIGEAARSYLAHGMLEPATEGETPQYIYNGPMPDARTVNTYQHEVQLLATFFKQASRNLRLTLSSCAVLCPNKNIGQALAQDLNKVGMEATYMEGRDLNLTCSGIKILTLCSSKGLEFPIVALAGFLTEKYPVIAQSLSEEGREELLARERRVMYVGMTRAMRALLVIVPLYPTTDLLRGFDQAYWNFKGIQ
jgi:superfamily I DNA/RNA helicase/mRNA-degrading endonuclease RelE of RelBE toxin-antitoxin system